MSEARLLQAEMLRLLWLLPLAVVLLVWAERRRRRALEAFAAPELLGRLGAARASRWIQTGAFAVALALVVIGLARPAWNPVPQTISRQGRDIVFVVDVSRSMLAEDLRPNRLERAKLSMLDAVAALEGDRVAVVAFAGAASVKCPLTLDYGFFRMAVEELSPESAPVGGSAIGDGLRKALSDIFDDKPSRYRDIVLITDGEDHDSLPEEAAREAGRRGVRLIAIGLGDENTGRRVPMTGPLGEKTFLKYKGQEVWSRLDADTLRRMTAATPGGRYLNVGAGAVDFGDVYRQMIAGAERREVESATIERYEEKFQIFLLLGFLLLCVEAAAGPGRARREASE